MTANQRGKRTPTDFFCFLKHGIDDTFGRKGML